MEIDNSKRVAIVTAAGSGMGAGIARELSRTGYLVAILSSSGRGEKLAAELGGIGITGSNSSIPDLERLVNTTMDAHGRIDVVVNSAGHGPKGSILDITDDEWRSAMDVYFLNVVRIARLVTPHMISNGGGSILNISTYATFEPEQPFPTSGVMRSALAAFVKLYADEFAEHNIRINNLLPGFVDSLPEIEQFRKRIPLGRYATVDEIARTAAFLVSDAAAYITGQNIRVDGGLTRSV